jgi:hypothetical protein
VQCAAAQHVGCLRSQVIGLPSPELEIGLVSALETAVVPVGAVSHKD